MEIYRRYDRKDLVVGGIYREIFNNNSTLSGDVHSIENSIAAEAKVAALMRRIEALELKRTPA